MANAIGRTEESLRWGEFVLFQKLASYISSRNSSWRAQVTGGSMRIMVIESRDIVGSR
jgi:hypothetical protein